MTDQPSTQEGTPGCYICDPSAFDSDEEACMACFMRWLDYVGAP